MKPRIGISRCLLGEDVRYDGSNKLSSAVADLTPFVALKNNIPLDQMNPPAKKLSDAVLRRDAYVSARLPLSKPDQCPEDTLNRILWHAMKGSQVPYPTWAVQLVDDD